MEEVTKEEQKTYMSLYESEEELRQLKVLAMVLKKNDLVRMGDVAIDVLKINSQNLIAKMVYELDVKKDVVINDISFYHFNSWIMENFLNKIAAVDTTLDTESFNILILTLSAFLNLLAFSSDCSEALLNKVFKCFNNLNSDNNIKRSFYQASISFFCNKIILDTLKSNSVDTGYPYSDIYYTANDIIKTRKICLILLKQKISSDASISPDEKNRLLNQIASTGLTATAKPVNEQQNPPRNRKIAYIGLGVLVVAGLVAFLIAFL